MKPTRSANSTVTSRRSATGDSTLAGVANRLSPTSSAAPQSPQNRFAGGFELPQEEQAAASALPQSPQNFFPAGFSVPQFVQTVTPRA